MGSLSYDSAMPPTHADETALDAQDLPAACERIVQLLLTAPTIRTDAEIALAQFLHNSTGPETKRHEAECVRIKTDREEVCAKIAAQLTLNKGEAQSRAQRQRTKLQESARTALAVLEEYRETQFDKFERSNDEAQWTANSIFEALVPQSRQEFEVARAAIEQATTETLVHVERIELLLRKARVAAPVIDSVSATDAAAPAPGLGNSLHDNPSSMLARSTVALAALRKSQLLLILRSWAAHLAAFILIGASSIFILERIAGGGVISDLVKMGAIIGAVILLQSLIWYWAGRRLAPFAAEAQTIRNLTSQSNRAALEQASRKRQSREDEIHQQHQMEIQAAQAAVEPKRDNANTSFVRRDLELKETATRLRRNSAAQLETTLLEAEQIATRAFEDTHRLYDQQLKQEVERHTSRMTEISAVHTARDRALRDHWKTARNQVFHDLKQVTTLDRLLFPQWTHLSWESFYGHASSIAAAKIGSISVSLNSIPGSLPIDSELAWPAGSPRLIHLPIVLTFPTRASLLIEAGQEGRESAIAMLQETVLRILTALPPGQARFTIIDPVGLGEGFAAFMHLTDEADHIIGERIWTDSKHIEQKLTDLCEHMETVIQKFLRNEFPNLDAYNRQAGEIAEPYRFLVMADFPVGLTDIAARKLASIINSGARCGVFPIILRDTRQPMPAGIDLADLRATALCLRWQDQRFVVCGSSFEQFPFTHGSIPEGDRSIGLLRRIAVTAKNAKRIEVPFSAIAPADSALWTETTDRSITVALGRSGATRLQHITLGIGTGQHALIAGKTGSGKSTLLHALITNLALRYSPDEAELWLIDFKKGVEFRTYATNKLPHARAVAIESDREFGLSVLRGLDAELRRRGEIFRDRSVQDLAGYRKLSEGPKIPRTLLIVDEFQELFTEDDKVSEESALLLDRLVRQGRAFGMHVILGSQTLGGAYSIARATMGQMAIRIALQCNEADSQLILSDDNVAARLLSRPGEAIYNDAGGLIEGNNPFQVVWLPDDERDRMLAKVRQLDAQHSNPGRPPMIVFEGSAPADIQGNSLMARAIHKRDRGEFVGPSLLWFGDAISIKDPTAVTLRRQSGTNIVLVGQREDAALAISAGALISLAAQYRTGECQVFLLDGTPPDDENFNRLAALHKRIGLAGQCGGLRDTESVLKDVVEELRRRQNDHASQAPTCLVLVHALHRFRSLRRNEDDFSYSSSGDKPPTADKLLAEVLREGPALGIHIMVTCDGATNLARSFDRNSVREFEWRVLFQVSASDSSTLIDSPIASRLGPQRVLLHSEETGVHEKFRPYAWPGNEWLDKVFPQP